MHSEHLQNVRPVHVAAGWLVAIAVTSLLLLVFTSLGMAGVGESDARLPLTSFVAIAVGFAVGGLFAGLRAIQAPVLHGILIALTSLLAWVVLSTAAWVIGGGSPWDSLSANATAAVLFVQIAAAIIGALMGYNIALRGKPGLSEHEPIS